MLTITRNKEVGITAMLAILTTAAVVIAKGAGSEIVAAFIAGAGSAVTVGYVVITNIKIKQARDK
jgi:hypothetical protein